MATVPAPTKRSAQALYRKIVAAFGETAHPVVRQGEGSWPTGPVLCQDYEGWTSTTAWAIVWETGDDWAIAAAYNYRALAHEAGLFIEPINGYALGIYRD